MRASPSNRFDPGSGGSSGGRFPFFFFFFGSAGGSYLNFWRTCAHFLGVIQPASKNNGILGRLISFSYALSTAFVASFKQLPCFFGGAEGEECSYIVAGLNFIPTPFLSVNEWRVSGTHPKTAQGLLRRLR